MFAPDAVRVALVVAQVNAAADELMDGVGGVVFEIRVYEALAVHPLAASVTVTVKVPGTETVREDAVEPLFHK